VSTCPKCQKTLEPFDYEGIELLHCTDCTSLWFQNGQFREVKQIGFSKFSELFPGQTTERSSQPSSENQELHCPNCQGHPLVSYAYAYSSDIQLYRCSKCLGIWADSAALIQIEALLDGYQESLAEAKAKVMPLMLQVKNQIQQEERLKEEQHKKKGFFNRLFGGKKVKNTKVQNIFESDEQEDDTLL